MEHAMTHPTTCEISQTDNSSKVDELAMLVRRLVQSLRKAAPGNELADQALDYLKRHRLTGTFLRGDVPNVPRDAPAGSKPSKACEAAGTLASASAAENVPAPQEPVAWRIRHRSEPGMFGHYPWSFTDRIRGGMLAHYEYEPLYAHHVQTPTVREFPAITPELASILGFMCFQCIPFAQALRAAGHEIKTRAEDEQAAVLHWMLVHWFRHGEDWREHAQADMERMRSKAISDLATHGRQQ
jgi:hypothetical protein